MKKERLNGLALSLCRPLSANMFALCQGWRHREAVDQPWGLILEWPTNCIILAQG
jgi:hypothetical protein